MSRYIPPTVAVAALAAVLISGAGAGSIAVEQPQANLKPLIISGEAQVRNTLISSGGKISRYAYRWLRCDSNGGRCSGLSNPTASHYTTSPTDASSTRPVLVTGSNKNGSAAAARVPLPVSAGSTTASSRAATAPTTPTRGRVLRRVNYEYPRASGVNPSIAGWQCADNTSSSGATRGTLTRDSSTSNSGAHSGRIANPPTDPSAAFGRSACEVLMGHTAKTGNNIYYALALRFPSSWSGGAANRRRGRGRSGLRHNTWATRVGVVALNYSSIPASGPLIVEAYSNRVAIALASGSCVHAVGCAYDNSCGGECWGHSNNVRCRPSCKIIPAGKLTLGVWHQIIIHVYETPYADGLVEAWWRRKGERGWNKTVRMSGMPTVALGTNSFGHVFTAATYNAGTRDITDKFGLQHRDFLNPVSINQDDNCISTSFHAAVRCLR